MNETKRGVLKGYFAPAARPTAIQFSELIDSLVHLNDANNNNLELDGSITLGNRLVDPRPLKAGTIRWNPATSKFEASYDGTTFVEFGGGASGNPLTIGKAVLGTPGAGALLNFAVLAHSNHNTDAKFAFAQSDTGNTIINADTNKSINFNNAGIPQMIFKNSKLTIGKTPAVATPLLEVFGEANKNLGGMWGVVSDKRVKKNIMSFDEGIEAIRKLRIVKFQFNGKGNTSKDLESIGVIAQEAKDVLPEAVNAYSAKFNEEDEFETEILSFNGSSLFYKMVNAIKDIDKRLAAIETKTKIKK